MFKRNCLNCGKSASKKYEFCPFCGASHNCAGKIREEDYGFLGKEDVRTAEDNFYAGMPLPFKMMIKPLMKELNKQVSEMNKELKPGQNGKSVKISEKVETRSINGKMPVTNFSIYIGAPGQKPVHINGSLQNRKMISSGPVNLMHVNGNKSAGVRIKKELPKFDKTYSKLRSLAKKEPETTIRRLADRIIYEISLPGVSSIKNINVAKMENGFEIKGYFDKILYTKTLSIDLPLADYSFEDNKLFLEFLPNK